MPLTVRTNGSSGSNIISASWFNDFLNLLTGSMQDQEVTIKNDLLVQAIGAAPSTNPSAAVVAGAGLGIGAYNYVYTYANADGESGISPVGGATTTSGNQKVNLSGVTVGPTGTTKRNIYRTAVGGGGTPTLYGFVASINDNTTTTYSDTTADGSLGAVPPAFPTFGGALSLIDSSSVKRMILGSDGSIFNNQAGSTVNGSVSGSATLYQPLQGTVKLVVVLLNAWRSASAGSLFLPTPFVQSGIGFTNGIGTSPNGGMGLNNRNSGVTAGIITSLATGGGVTGGQTIVNGWSFFGWPNGGSTPAPVDQVKVLANTAAQTGIIILLGV